MDAVEFLKEKRRMCKTIRAHSDCDKCGLVKESSDDCDTRCFVFPEEAVAVVENWAKEHPAITREIKFLEMFPNAPISHNVIDICPSKVDVLQKCPKVTPDTMNMCEFCKRTYWLAEVD